MITFKQFVEMKLLPGDENQLKEKANQLMTTYKEKMQEIKTHSSDDPLAQKLNAECEEILKQFYQVKAEIDQLSIHK